MHSLTFYVLQKTNLISWNDLVKVMDKFAAFASISREEAFRRCYTMYNVYESAFSRIADKEERYFETFLGLYAVNEILPNLSLNINQHRNASEVILKLEKVFKDEGRWEFIQKAHNELAKISESGTRVFLREQSKWLDSRDFHTNKSFYCAIFWEEVKNFNFAGSSFENAVFHQPVEGCNFTGANLSYAEFKSSVTECIFTGAKLIGTNFERGLKVASYG